MDEPNHSPICPDWLHISPVKNVYDKRERRIVAVAILYDGQVYYAHEPMRHHNIAHAMSEMGLSGHAHREQGFMTDDGLYVSRAAARYIAEKAGQMIRRTHHDKLFSEDLW